MQTMKLRLNDSKWLLALLLTLFSCRNDENDIPESEVYVKTSYSEYQALMMPNSAVVYEKNNIYPANFKLGYGGVVIFRDMDRQVHCCDLSCPYENLRTVNLTIKMPYATCPECGSKFDLTYGACNPVMGPATCGLKLYHNIRDTGDYIKVVN